MALLYYTFNNQDSKDYSENGLDGTDTSITYTAADYGYNAVFNGDSDNINMGTFTGLNGLNYASFYFRINFDASSGTKYVIYKNGQFNATWDGTDFTFYITGGSGTSFVGYAPNTTDYYQFHVIYNNDGSDNTMRLYVNGVEEDNMATSGTIVTNSNNAYLGGDGGGVNDTARFLMNEFKVLNVVLNTSQITTHINNPNGLKIYQAADLFELGDILATNINGTNKGYGVVSYVNGNDVRIQPVNTYINAGGIFVRVGNLWDTTRQYSVQVTSTGINFYNGVSLSSEAFTESKLVKADTITANTVLDYGTLTGGINNYDIPDNNFISINAGASASITGIAAQSYPRRVVLINRNASNSIRLYNNSGSSSTANRFDLVADYNIVANKSVEIFYDTLAARWRIIKE